MYYIYVTDEKAWSKVIQEDHPHEARDIAEYYRMTGLNVEVKDSLDNPEDWCI